MSAEIEQPKTKRCTGCLDYFPATTEFFHHDQHSATGLRSRCRWCRYSTQDERSTRTHTVSRTVNAAPYVPGPKPCSNCHDMPWRVAGPRCPCCQLNYAPEPRPEFVLRRFDRCG